MDASDSSLAFRVNLKKNHCIQISVENIENST